MATLRAELEEAIIIGEVASRIRCRSAGIRGQTRFGPLNIVSLRSECGVLESRNTIFASHTCGYAPPQLKAGKPRVIADSFG